MTTERPSEERRFGCSTRRKHPRIADCSGRMASMSSVWLLHVVFVCMVQICWGQEAHLELPGNFVAPPVVSVIEGANVSISCYSDIANSSTIWSKPGNTDFYRAGSDLKIEKVRQEHGGAYVCSIFNETGVNVTHASVDVNVLYGIGRLTISGPNSALKEEIVNVTCSADSNPSPSFYWSYQTEGWPVAHRGPSFTEAHFPERFKFYCFAETTLVPTQGESVTSSASTWKKVTEHVGAYIYNLSKTLYVEEGSTLDIGCTVYGRPTPDVYWTGPGPNSNNTVSSGSRWIVPNVRKSLENTYVCHAENTITDGTGHSTWTSDAEMLRIIVVQTGTSSTTNDPCSSVCTDPQVATPERSCNNGVIAALVIGWIVALILFLIGLFYYIRIRDKRKTPSWSKHHPPSEPPGDSVVKARSTVDHERPTPPKRPIEREDSQHSYMSLDAATQNQQKPTGGYSTPAMDPKTPTDDYLTPQSYPGSSEPSVVQPSSSQVSSVDQEARPCVPDGGNSHTPDSATDHTYESMT